MALLLAISSWTSDRPSSWIPGETDAASAILTAAGWRVVTVTADMPIGVAWEMVNRTHPARGIPTMTTRPPMSAAGPPTAAIHPPATANP
jgi:hypothetical protein